MKGFKKNFEDFLRDKSKKKKFRDTYYYLNEESQEKTLDIQTEKQKLMDQMHDLLKKVDEGQEVFFDEQAKKIEGDESGIMTCFKENNEQRKVTHGDIMAAGINGISLSLGANIDRSIKKEFILRETKRRIQHLFNKQIILAEQNNLSRSPHDRSIEAYNAIAERIDLASYENEQPGLVAETAVESFLTKIFIDNPSLPFEIESVDVYDDVRRKMDFKIHIKKEYTRGIKIDAQQHTGVQFTLNKQKEYFKKQQIERAKKKMERLEKKPVNDLVLVSISLNDIQKSLQEWKKDEQDRAFGGPAEYWDKETKKLVFTKMLEKLPEELNINPEEFWDNIQK